MLNRKLLYLALIIPSKLPLQMGERRIHWVAFNLWVSFWHYSSCAHCGKMKYYSVCVVGYDTVGVVKFGLCSKDTKGTRRGELNHYPLSLQWMLLFEKRCPFSDSQKRGNHQDEWTSDVDAMMMICTLLGYYLLCQFPRLSVVLCHIFCYISHLWLESSNFIKTYLARNSNCWLVNLWFRGVTKLGSKTVIDDYSP